MQPQGWLNMHTRLILLHLFLGTQQGMHGDQLSAYLGRDHSYAHVFRAAPLQTLTSNVI